MLFWETRDLDNLNVDLEDYIRLFTILADMGNNLDPNLDVTLDCLS